MKKIKGYLCSKCCEGLQCYNFDGYGFFKKCGVCGNRYLIINKISYYKFDREDMERILESVGGASSIMQGKKCPIE